MSFRRRAEAATRALILAATAAFAATALAGAGKASFWLDEAFSVALAEKGWSTFWRTVWDSEANMSLYYVLLRPWLVLGSGESTVRALSVIFAAACVPAIYVLARVLFSSRALGLAAAFILASNAFVLAYAQEARGYALVLLLSIVSTLEFVWWLEGRRRAVLLYAFTAALSVYAHFFAIFVLASHLAALPFSPRRPPQQIVIRTFGAIAALAAPLLAFVTFRNSGQVSWIKNPSASDVVEAVKTLTGGGFVLLGGYIIVCGAAVARFVTLLRARMLSRELFAHALVLAGVVFTLGAPLVISLLGMPIFVPRYLIVAVPSLTLVLVAGLGALRDRRLQGIAFAALLLLGLHATMEFRRNVRKEDWRGAVRYTAQYSRPGDGIIFYAPYVRIPFEYYLRKDVGARARLVALFPAVGWGGTSLSRAARTRDPDLAVLRARIARRQRVWLVRADEDAPRRRRTSRRLVTLLANRELARQHSFSGSSINVELYADRG